MLFLCKSIITALYDAKTNTPMVSADTIGLTNTSPYFILTFVYRTTARKFKTTLTAYATTVPIAAPFTFILLNDTNIHVNIILNIIPINMFFTGIICLPIPCKIPTSVNAIDKNIIPNAIMAKTDAALAALVACFG